LEQKHAMKTAISLLTVILLGITASPAAADECGQPISNGEAPRAVDALHILRSSIGARQCTLGACDLNSDCEVSVGDALRTLVASVGGDAERDCDSNCPTEILCEDAGAPTCNGLCPAEYVCTADKSGDVEPDERATVCHVPPGNPAKAHTIVVGVSSVSAHLRHGDYLGPCDADCTDEADCAEILPIADHREDGDSDSHADSDRDSDSSGDSDKDSDSHADSDSDSDSDSDISCLCEPRFVSTTTLPVETTTTTSTTSTTTLPEPTTTTTLPPNTTTTTIEVDPPDTTTTTAPPPPDTTTTTTTPPDTTTTTIVDPPDTTTTTVDQGTTTTTTTTSTTIPAPEGDMDNDGLADEEDPCADDARNACVGPAAIDLNTENPIRVNANASGADECSGDRIDCSGDMWFADFGFNDGGGGHSECSLGGGEPNCVLTGIVELFGCEDDATEDILQCEHFDRPADPELMYAFNVPNGSYVVNLFFANTFDETAEVGDRVFDIVVEGNLVYPEFDQIAAAGGSGRAVVRSAVVTVIDGDGLSLSLIHGTENPSIKAIEILTATP
jgi:hypothetical protein